MTQVRPHKHLRPDERAELRNQLDRDYRAGASIRLLSEQYSLSYGRINRMLAEARTPKRPRGPRPRPEDNATD